MFVSVTGRRMIWVDLSLNCVALNGPGFHCVLGQNQHTPVVHISETFTGSHVVSDTRFLLVCVTCNWTLELVFLQTKSCLSVRLSVQDFVTGRTIPGLFWVGLSDWRTGRWEWVNQTPYVMERRYALSASKLTDDVFRLSTAGFLKPEVSWEYFSSQRCFYFSFPVHFCLHCVSVWFPDAGCLVSLTAGGVTAWVPGTKTVLTCTTVGISMTCTAPPRCATSARNTSCVAEQLHPAPPTLHILL